VLNHGCCSYGCSLPVLHGCAHCCYCLRGSTCTAAPWPQLPLLRPPVLHGCARCCCCCHLLHVLRALLHHSHCCHLLRGPVPACCCCHRHCCMGLRALLLVLRCCRLLPCGSARCCVTAPFVLRTLVMGRRRSAHRGGQHAALSMLLLSAGCCLLLLLHGVWLPGRTLSAAHKICTAYRAIHPARGPGCCCMLNISMAAAAAVAV
jgi:hypothetical protein